jgi:hypothetical protein
MGWEQEWLDCRSLDRCRTSLTAPLTLNVITPPLRSGTSVPDGGGVFSLAVPSAVPSPHAGRVAGI